MKWQIKLKIVEAAIIVMRLFYPKVLSLFVKIHLTNGQKAERHLADMVIYVEKAFEVIVRQSALDQKSCYHF